MKVNIIAISDSDKHFDSAIQEYLKRLGKDCSITTIKPEKNGTRDQIIHKETTKILEKIQWLKDTYVILLAKEGKQISTEQFTNLIKKHNTITFIIGWPYGLDHTLLKQHLHDSVAFGAMTMPHGLAKLVILEQVYRAKMIMEWREYHY